MHSHTIRECSRHLPSRRVLCSVGALTAFALLACGVVQAASQAIGEATPATRIATTEHFDFYSDPWINLHHFLYQWAREEQGLGSGRQHVPVPERSSLRQLPDPDQRAWMRVVAFYRDSVAALSHFAPQMLQQKRQLLEMNGDPDATPPDALPGIAAALASAMPIYRSRWWPTHDRANRVWMASIVPRLHRQEEYFVELTKRIYAAEWPTVLVRVDVSAYANPRAGYTADGHIVIYSTDPGNQDLYGLETLSHEVQHTREVGSAARERLTKAFEAAGIAEPANLWHGVIFATAGAFVQSVAERERLPAHVPYWIRENFQTLQGWSAVVTVTREHWLPVIRGDASAEDGFAALVKTFSRR